METNNEIGVFGDIIGIPAAGLPQCSGTKMVGRTAEWQRQMQGRKSGQESIELAGIGSREHPREPVVDRQRCLEAGEPLVRRHERIKSPPDNVQNLSHFQD
jgi:hypothetical protein